MAVESKFEPFPSLARINRNCIITEKIDGSNAAVVITEDGDFFTQSRKRVIVPGDDNFGFAKWAHEQQDELTMFLGPGRHYGEWWGSGIQRGYGLPKGEKRFSLFNTPRWSKYVDDPETGPWPHGLYMVPELFVGKFSTETIEGAKQRLKASGSVAAPGFDNPEGVVVFHTAARTAFKSTYDDCDSYEWGGGKTWQADKA